MLIVTPLCARIVTERPCLRKDIEPLPLRFRASGAAPAPDGSPSENTEVVFRNHTIAQGETVMTKISVVKVQKLKTTAVAMYPICRCFPDFPGCGIIVDR